MIDGIRTYSMGHAQVYRRNTCFDGNREVVLLVAVKEEVAVVVLVELWLMRLEVIR